MELLPSVLIGICLRLILLKLPSEFRAILVGLWEGVCLHRLTANMPQSPDPYLAYTVRLAMDLVLNQSIVSLMITVLWSVLSLLALAASSHGYDTRKQARIQRARRSERRHHTTTRSVPRVPIPMPALFSPRLSANEPPSPPSFFLNGESDSLISPERIHSHLPTPPDTLIHDNETSRIIIDTTDTSSDDDEVTTHAKDTPTPPVQSTPTPSIHRLSTVPEESYVETPQPTTIPEIHSENSHNAEPQQAVESLDVPSYPSRPPSRQLSNGQPSRPPSAPPRQILFRSEVSDSPRARDSLAQGTAVMEDQHDSPDFRPVLPVQAIDDLRSLVLQPTSPLHSDLDPLQTPPHLRENLGPMSPDLDELQTPKRFDDEDLVDTDDEDPLRTPIKARQPLSPLLLSIVSEPQPDVPSASQEVAQAENMLQNLANILQAEVAAAVASSSSSTTVDNNLPIPVPQPRPALDEEQKLEALSTGQMTPSDLESVISDAEALAIESKAVTLREQAWQADRKLRGLKNDLDKALRMNKPREAFLLKAEIADFTKEMEKLHRSAERRFLKARNMSNEHNQLPTVDVHGLLIPEAIRVTESEVRRALLAGQTSVRVITGRGMHSKDKVAKLKPAIMTHMSGQKFVCTVEPHNPGVVVISCP